VTEQAMALYIAHHKPALGAATSELRLLPMLASGRPSLFAASCRLQPPSDPHSSTGRVVVAPDAILGTTFGGSWV